MNYHSIEVMIKEQRRDEEERWNRMRMLKQACCQDENFRGRLAVVTSQKLSSWKNTGKSLIWVLLHKISQRNHKVKST